MTATSHFFRGLLVATILLVLSLTACDSATDDGADTTVDQDRENIEAALDEAIAFTRSWTDGAFSEKIETLVNEGENVDEAWVEDLMGALEDEFDLSADEEAQAFLFDQHTGVYTWQPSSESWQRTAGAGAITLRFPSSPDEPANDVEFRLSGYQDTAVTIDGEALRLPTAFSMEASFDGETLMSLSVSGVQYSNDDPAYPTAASIELFSAPTTFTLGWAEAANTFEINLAADDGETEVAVDLTFDLAQGYHDAIFDEEYVEWDDVVEEMEGSLRIGENMEFVLEADVADFAEIVSSEEPTEAEINAVADVRLVYDGQDIGHLDVSVDEEGFFDDVVVVYKDDSQESVERYESGLDDLAELIEDYVAQFEFDDDDF